MSFLTLQSASDVPDLDVEDLLPFGEVFHNRRQLLARALQTLRHHPTVEIESVLRAIYQLAESLQSLEDALETRGDVVSIGLTWTISGSNPQAAASSLCRVSVLTSTPSTAASK